MPLLQVDSLLSARHSVPMANCSPASRAGPSPTTPLPGPREPTTPTSTFRGFQRPATPLRGWSGSSGQVATGPGKDLSSKSSTCGRSVELALSSSIDACGCFENRYTAGRAEHARPDESRRLGTPQVLEMWWSQRSSLLQKQKEADRKTHPFLLLPSLREYPLGFTLHVLCSLIFVDRTQAM